MPSRQQEGSQAGTVSPGRPSRTVPVVTATSELAWGAGADIGCLLLVGVRDVPHVGHTILVEQQLSQDVL